MVGRVEGNGEMAEDLREEPYRVHIVNDESAGIYEAVVDGRPAAGLTYDVVGGDRLVLLAVSVLPQFRNHGVGTELIRHVLDDARAQRKTVTIVCPIVRAFIAGHHEYADLVDPAHPGVGAASHEA